MSRRVSLWSKAHNVMSARRSSRAMAICAGLIVALSAEFHLQTILGSQGASFDIQSYSIQAATVLHHQNVYAVTTRYPYPPVWVWIVTLMQIVSSATNLPFNQVVKIPGTLGDLFLVIVIYLYSYDRFGPSIRALLPAVLYGLNPIALIITAGHGQFDGLVIFFVAASVYLRGDARKQAHWYWWSATLLGVAVALKGYPVILAPYVVLTAPKGRRLGSALFLAAPLILSVAIYTVIFGYSPNMIPQVLGYQSNFDAGWGFLLLHIVPTIPLSTLRHLSTIAKVLLIAIATVVPALISRRSFATSAVLVFAALYATTFAMEPQYSLWILPFLCMAMPWWVIPYSPTALTLMVSFYTRYFPMALPSGLGWQVIFGPLANTLFFGVAGVVGMSALIALSVVIKSTAPWYGHRS